MATRLAMYRFLTLRIDEIPAERSHDAFKHDIEAVINQDPDLNRGVASVVHHHLVKREPSLACATASFKTSIPKDELVKRLDQASTHLGYLFDVHFGGVTLLYESPAGADTELVANA